MNKIIYREMKQEDIEGVVALQASCFPPPFPEDLLWKPQHLERHLTIFPEGQFVAVIGGTVIGSASASRITEDHWQAHLPWEETLGGFFFDTYSPTGTTLYGADISVHPDYRKRGIGRGLYQCRFDAVKGLTLKRYGTACRIPGFQEWNEAHQKSVAEYCEAVRDGKAQDRTLSPLLRLGLSLCGVIDNYMEDEESGNSAALLEWVNR